MDRTFGSPRPHRRIGRRGLLALLATLAVGSLGAGAFSLAIFTDTSAADGTFTAGTIDIATNPSTLFTVTNLMPGDTTSSTLTVQNNGTGQLRYSMVSSSTNADTKDLRSQLSLDVKAGACPGSGTSLYSGVLGASTAAFGNPAAGAQAGDRTLAAGTSEQLCFAATLPLATGNAYQGAATTTAFTFNAEQTANN